MNVRFCIKDTINVFLVSALFFSLFPSISYAGDPVETRYMRSDTFSWDLTYYAFNTTNSASHVTDSATWQTVGAGHGYLRSLIYVKYQDNTTALIATSAGFEVTSSTPTEYSETVNIPGTALNTTDRIMVTVQYSPDGSTWTNMGYSFLTEQLGATLLNSATWTIYYWADFTSIYNPFLRRYNNELVFYHGDSDYPSRIEGFSYTTGGVTKEWHDISLWTFNLTTRKWFNVTSWNFNISVMQWNTVSMWSFTVLTKTWHNLATWTFNVITKTWNAIAEWSFQIWTRTWHNLVEWNFNLITHGWHTISYWILTVSTTNIPILFMGIIFTVSILFLVILIGLKKKR